MNILYRIKDEILPKNKLLSLLDEKKNMIQQYSLFPKFTFRIMIISIIRKHSYCLNTMGTKYPLNNI